MTATGAALPQGSSIDGWSCPAPLTDPGKILLGHGSGGRMSAELTRKIFLPVLGSHPALRALEDQASLPLDAAAVSGGARLALTTDSFVVRPIFFPGGDIGRLAVAGTVNDLAVGGAEPLHLAAAFILEEGLPLEELQRVLVSMRTACEEAGVSIVAGDTKVVDRGKCDKIFITTTGIGLIPGGRMLSISSARAGDRILLSGPIGDHGIAILSVREGIEFESTLQSDAAPLNSLTAAMLRACPFIRCMRDPTRGGLSSALNELASASRAGVKITESAIPVRPQVTAACEMFGLDPLCVASEGRLIAVAPAVEAGRLLEAMRRHPAGRDAAIIGEVVADHPGTVALRTVVGGERVVSMLSGEQLPRIC